LSAKKIQASVVVPVRDNSSGLKALVQCLTAQTLSRDSFEVVIADDGSRRPPVQAPEAFGEWLRVTSSRRQNSYIGRNRGVELARGAVLAFIDADCLPSHGWLEAGLTALKSADLVAGAVDPIFPSPPTAWSIIDATLFDQERFVAMGKAATANLFVTRELFASVGGFDPSLPSGGDWDFVERSVARGARLRYAPDAVVKHPPRTRALPFLVAAGGSSRRGECAATVRGPRCWRSTPTSNPFSPRRWRFAVGYDPVRMRDLGLTPSFGNRIGTMPHRYLMVPMVEASAQAVGWARAACAGLAHHRRPAGRTGSPPRIDAPARRGPAPSSGPEDAIE
jgi:hypothetical protein